jgi:cell wall-associated NlpC family hydrolase
MLQPVGLSEVTTEIGAIDQLLEGGFASVLAAMASSAEAPAAPASAEVGPAGAGVGLPTAVVATGLVDRGNYVSAAGPATAPFSTIAPFNNGLGPAGTGAPITGTSAPATGTGALTSLGPSYGAGGVDGQAPPGLDVTSPGGGSSLGSRAVALAESLVGAPYLWGGESPGGFDCSGLVQYVYRQLGVDLPRTSEEQAIVGTPVPALADAQPGDLVFFPGSDGTAEHPGHVGIYLGNGEMVDAPYSGTVVQVQAVGHPSEIRRVLPQPGTFSAVASSGAGSQRIAELGLLPSGQFGPSAASPSAGGDVPYGAVFAQAAADYGLPDALLEAMATAESGMDPKAVSPAGAEGIMQLMPGVASRLGVDPFDPPQAIPAAASLMSGYLREFGSLKLALAAYNAGPGAVLAFGGMPPYPETQAYVTKVLGLMGGPA